MPCTRCGTTTKTYIVSVLDVLKEEPEATPMCHRCIEAHLDDNELDAILVYSRGKGKWEGRSFFEKAILIDGSPQKLFAYAHRMHKSWKDLYCTARVWYDTQKQAEITDIVNKYLNASTISTEISPAQIKLINILLQQADCMESRARIYAEFNVDSLTKLTKQQALTIIKRMKGE